MVRTCGTSLVCLVHLVYLVGLVYPVSLVQPNKQDKPNKPIKRDRPNRPHEQDRLADFFSILLTSMAKASRRGSSKAPNRDLPPYRGGYGGPRLPMWPTLAHA